MVFNHSIKVPPQYKRSAKILQVAIEEKKPIRNLVFEEKRNIRSVSAIIKAFSDNKDKVEQLIEGSKILTDNPRLDKYLCKVLVSELYFGSKKINSAAKPIEIVKSYDQKFNEILGENGHETKAKKRKPRYVRINNSKTSLQEFEELLQSEGFTKIETVFGNYADFLAAVDALKDKEYLEDMHVSGLLIFPSSTSKYFARHNWVEEKKLFLQDKGTSLVAEILQPQKGSTVLDMCAAPGMKSIHCSNMMHNEGTIYAVERDSKRYKLLCDMTTKAGATIVKPINADILELGDKDVPGVEYILVDPSCSGSGMQSRLNVSGSDEKDEARLKKLGGLQIKILLHAMTKFPNVKRIAYSTCSLYEEENEHVIKKCLSKTEDFKLISCKKALRNKWSNTGSKDYEGIGKNCLYSRPDSDFCDGIFIAVFERKNTVE